MDVAVESQPRPMPPEVLRAYRDPMPLRELLASSVYSAADQVKVRDALLKALLKQHGDPWVDVGAKGWSQPVSKRVRAFRKNVAGIEFLLEVPDYGGRYATLPVLARVMQPVWSAWWSAFEWRGPSSIQAWCNVAELVLGERQLRWLAAQYARTAFDRVRAADRRVALGLIEAAEAYAVEPTRARLEAMQRARSAAADAADAAFYASDAYAAAYAAAATSTFYAAADAAFYASDAYAASAAASSYQRLVDLTRRLISPQLIASESSGVRASPW